ncbi:MAG: YtxH domain-containing protein [Microbacteriaceae bacterium]
MKGKILLATGLAVGYVLGTRAGRERYEQIAAFASRFWNDPRVQRQVHTAEDFVKDKAPDVAGFVADQTKKAASAATGRGRSTGTRATSTRASGTRATGTRTPKPRGRGSASGSSAS